MGEDADSTTWYYAAGGQQVGPVLATQLQELLNTGQVSWSTLVWTAGMEQWKPASAVAALTGFVAAVAPPLPVTVERVDPVSYYGTTQQVLPQGMAITSLVLGICSFALACVQGLNLLTFPAAIGAIVTGIIARRQVKRGEAAGGGMALAGFILGIAYFVIFVGAIILILGLLGVMWKSAPNNFTPLNIPNPSTLPIER